MRMVSPYLLLRIVYPSAQRGATQHRFAVVAVGMSWVINGRVAHGRSTTRGAAAKHRAATRRFQRGTLAAMAALVLFAVSLAPPAHAQQTSGGAGGNYPGAQVVAAALARRPPPAAAAARAAESGNSAGGGGGGAGTTGGSGGAAGGGCPWRWFRRRGRSSAGASGESGKLAVAALAAAVVVAARTARWSPPRRPIRLP